MNLEERVRMLVEQWSLEEIFEMCDIEPSAVLMILYQGSYITLPEFILDREDGQDETS